MAECQLPSVALLRQLLRYESDTGLLFWEERPVEMFIGGKYSPERRAASWNSRCAGREAFTYVNSAGYRTGAINDTLLLAHRVIWAIHYGIWPEHDVDHIDGDKLNNRIANIRDVPQAVNTRNAVGKSNNTSGVTGVSFRPDRGKWRARIMIDYREINLGHFDTLEEATIAREAALKQYDFTDRHGSFDV